MSIGFESAEVQLQRLRERLRLMSDEELVRFGKSLRRLCANRVSGVSDPIEQKLNEARAEWRRRHPPAAR